MIKYTMTILVIMVVGFATFFGLTNTARANSACFQVASSEWATQCNADPNALELTVKNACKEKMALLSCMDKTDGKKDCKVNGSVAGGATVKIFTCNASGSYEFVGCEKAYDCQLELKKKMGQ